MKIEKTEKKDKTSVHKRFDQMIDSLEMSKNAFAQRLGIASTQIYNITSGKNSPSHEMYLKIAVAFPNINLGWLITGVGSIYTDTTLAQADETANFMDMLKKMEGQLDMIIEHIQTEEERTTGEKVLTYLEKLAKIKNHESHHLRDNKILEATKKQKW